MDKSDPPSPREALVILLEDLRSSLEALVGVLQRHRNAIMQLQARMLRLERAQEATMDISDNER